jgi:hypothetical protein
MPAQSSASQWKTGTFPWWVAVLTLCGAAGLFLFANRVAYRCYFQPDDYETLGQVATQKLGAYVAALFSDRVRPEIPRPLGQLFYAVMDGLAGARFPWWIAALHVLHFATVASVYALLRRLDAHPTSAVAGALLFLFHPAVFPIYWRPTYVYDLLCALFCVWSLVAYVRGRWILSFILFYFAMRSKELAALLPAVLACYEAWLGEKRWRRLVPFVLTACWLGLQSMVVFEDKSETYGFTFGFLSLAKTLWFYAGQLLKVPLLAPALLLVPVCWKDPRVRWGVAAFGLLLLPMLLLPERLNGALLYVPLLGVAVALGVAARKVKPAYVALFFLFWWGWSYARLRPYRGKAFVQAAENRAYLEALLAYAPKQPQSRMFIYEVTPVLYSQQAVEGALRYAFRRQDVAVQKVDVGNVAPDFWDRPATVLGWDLAAKKLVILDHDPERSLPSYIVMDGSAPLWALGEGWNVAEPLFRWTGPSASAKLAQPETATHFEVTLNVGPAQLRQVGGAGVHVYLDGEPLGEAAFREEGWKTACWKLKTRRSGVVTVRLETPVPLQLPRAHFKPLGAAVMKFGFVSR